MKKIYLIGLLVFLSHSNAAVFATPCNDDVLEMTNRVKKDGFIIAKDKHGYRRQIRTVNAEMSAGDNYCIANGYGEGGKAVCFLGWNPGYWVDTLRCRL